MQFGNHGGGGGRKPVRARGPGRELAAPPRMSEATAHKFPPTQMPQHELNKDNNSRLAGVEKGKMRRSTLHEERRPLRNEERGRDSLNQGRAQQLVIQYQMVSSADMHR